MKILIDGRLIAKKPTGISRYSLELIKAYNSRYGVENIFVLANFDLTFIIPNKIIYTNFKPYNLFHFVLCPFFLKLNHFDLFHIPFYSGPIWHCKKIKVICTVHDLMFYKVQFFFTKNKWINTLSKFYYFIIVNLTLRTSNIIITVSEATRIDIKNIFNRDALVFHGGVNRIEQYSEEIIELDIFNVQKRKYFLYVGNGRPHKNLEFLISTFIKYKGDKKLLIIGNKTSYSNYNDDRLIQIDYVNDNKLSYLYKNCTAFVFPSKYEGFGLPILEAISNKCLIFSSNAGSLSEFNFNSILFFNPNNQSELLSLLNNSDNYEFNINDLKLLKHYRWENIFKQMFDMIEQKIKLCTI
jgi:glycosyltransferase involved in cell wall biosynthesis